MISKNKYSALRMLAALENVGKRAVQWKWAKTAVLCDLGMQNFVANCVCIADLSCEYGFIELPALPICFLV